MAVQAAAAAAVEAAAAITDSKKAMDQRELIQLLQEAADAEVDATAKADIMTELRAAQKARLDELRKSAAQAKN